MSFENCSKLTLPQSFPYFVGLKANIATELPSNGGICVWFPKSLIHAMQQNIPLSIPQSRRFCGKSKTNGRRWGPMLPELSQTTRHHPIKSRYQNLNLESRQTIPAKGGVGEAMTLESSHINTHLPRESLLLKYSNPSYSYFTALSCRTL